jgi:hypothetical protein
MNNHDEHTRYLDPNRSRPETLELKDPFSPHWPKTLVRQTDIDKTQKNDELDVLPLILIRSELSLSE